jgi:hypothetical protein
MIININNPVFNKLIFFTIIITLIHIKKPNIVYDNKKKEYRHFGTINGKTLLPIYVIGILLAITIYVFFNNMSKSNNSDKYVINKCDLEQKMQHIHTQIQQQILQQQILQQQINNNQQLLQQNIKIPNNFNIYD